jgi:hypothetical protein
MANFAVLDGVNVINTIIADSKTIVEEITGKLCIEFNETNRAEVGGTYLDGVFISRKPYASWVLINNNWTPPILPPEFNSENPENYIWDEDSQSWIKE